MKRNQQRKGQQNLVLDKIAEALCAKLEAGVNPWVKPWDCKGKPTGNARHFAVNYVTNKPYQGINAVILAPGYYVTFKQAIGLGGKPAKGKGQKAVFAKDVEISLMGDDITYYLEVIKDLQPSWHGDNRNYYVVEARRGHKSVTIAAPLTDEGEFTGELMLQTQMLRLFDVWAIEDCGIVPDDDHKPEPEKPVDQTEAMDRAERLINNYAGQLKGGISFGGDRAFYRPSSDEIHLPRRQDFKNQPMFFSTAFHEMTHSTGHESRLARKGVIECNGFGSQTYSKEELVAEMGAAFMMGYMGIATEGTLNNSAAYLASWASSIRGNKTLREKVIFATNDAKAAFGLLLSYMPVEAPEGKEIPKEKEPTEEPKPTAPEFTSDEASTINEFIRAYQDSKSASFAVYDFGARRPRNEMFWEILKTLGTLTTNGFMYEVVFPKERREVSIRFNA